MPQPRVDRRSPAKGDTPSDEERIDYGLATMKHSLEDLPRKLRRAVS